MGREGHPDHYHSVTDFYADITNKEHAVPLFMSESLEPLGRQLGKNNRTWSNFTYTAVPSSKFTVHGVDTCPMAKNCQSEEAQSNSLRSRNYYTFLRNLPEPLSAHPVAGGFQPKMK